MAFRQALSNPDLWDGEVTQMCIVRFFPSREEAQKEQQARREDLPDEEIKPTDLKIGAVILTGVLHYVVEFLNPENPQGGFRIVSEDVIECITDVTVQPDFHDGQSSSYLFEMKTFGSSFTFCVWDYFGEGEGMRSEAAKRASKRLAKALQGLPCVSFKNDYLAGALGESTADLSAQRSVAASPVVKQGIKMQPVNLVSALVDPASAGSIHRGKGATEMTTVTVAPQAFLDQHRQIMHECNARRNLEQHEHEEYSAILLNVCKEWNKLVDLRKLSTLVDEMKQLHTTIESYELFDHAEGSAGPSPALSSSPSGRLSSSTSQLFSPLNGGGPVSSGDGGIRRRLSFKFSGGNDPESRAALFSKFSSDEAKRLTNEFEKAARQKCHKYFTGQQRQFVERRKALEKDLNSKQLREATTKYEEERNQMSSQMDLALRELRRLRTVNQNLVADLSATQKREQSVLERSRKREQELAQLSSSFASPNPGAPTARTPGSGGTALGKSPSLQYDESKPKGGFNFFASTPQQSL